MKDKNYKYEYDHYDLGYGLHYGVHSIFGKHIALGNSGAGMVHIYPYKIFIGDNHDNAIELTPEQQKVIENAFRSIERGIQIRKVQPEIMTKNVVINDGEPDRPVKEKPTKK